MSEEPSAPPSVPPTDSQGDGALVRPMTIAAATAWSAGIVLAFWMLMVMIAPGEEGGAASDLIGNSACQAIAYLLGLFLILRAYAPDAAIRDFLGIRGTNAAFYPLAILIGAAVEIPVQTLYSLISRRWPAPPESEDRLLKVFTESGTAKRAAIGLLLVFLGPLVEEVFFRGALFRPLLKRYPAVIVVTITSIFFAISHGMPQMFVPIAIVGAAMGCLRFWSGSLVPSLLLHATFNAVPFYALATADPGTNPVDDTSMPPLWLTAVTSVAAIVLLGLAALLSARSTAAASARSDDLK